MNITNYEFKILESGDKRARLDAMLTVSKSTFNARFTVAAVDDFKLGEYHTINISVDTAKKALKIEFDAAADKNTYKLARQTHSKFNTCFSGRQIGRSLNLDSSKSHRFLLKQVSEKVLIAELMEPEEN